MCRTGDGEVRRCDIQGFDSILGHFVKVWRVHITVVIPSETIEGDEQQLLSLVVYRSAEDGWGPEEAETGCPQHGEHRHFTDLNWISSPANTLIYKQTHLLASTSGFWSQQLLSKVFQLILSCRLDRLYLSSFLHVARLCLWATFTAGSCVHSEFPPRFALEDWQ